MRFPPKFRAELDRWELIMARSVDGMSRAQSLAHHRRTLEEFRALYARWRLRLPDPAARRWLEDFRESFEGPFVVHLEGWFAREVDRVLVLWEQRVKLARIRGEHEAEHPGVAEIEGLPDAGAAAEKLTTWQRLVRTADGLEVRSREALDALALEWPERVGRLMRERFAALDEAGARAWREELAPQVAALEAAEAEARKAKG